MPQLQINALSDRLTHALQHARVGATRSGPAIWASPATASDYLDARTRYPIFETWD